MSRERLPRVTPQAQNADQAALRAAILGSPRGGGPVPMLQPDGSLSGPFGLMLRAPALGEPLQQLGSVLRFQSSLTDRHREIAVLLVAARLDSGFEWYAHSRLGRAAGLTEEELGAFADDSFSQSARDDLDLLVARTTECLLRDEDLPDATWAEVVDRLGEPALHELVVLVGYYRLLASWMRVCHIDAPLTDDPELLDTADR